MSLTSLLRAIYILGLAASVTACTNDVLIPIPPHTPSSAPSALSRVAARTVEVRVEETKLAHNPVGLIFLPRGSALFFSEPGPDEVVANALRSELRAAGHTVVFGPRFGIEVDVAPIKLKGRLNAFDMNFEGSKLFGSVDVWIDVFRRGREARVYYAVYEAECEVALPQDTKIVEAHQLDSEIGRLFSACVGDIARRFRDDTAMAQALGG